VVFQVCAYFNIFIFEKLVFIEGTFDLFFTCSQRGLLILLQHLNLNADILELEDFVVAKIPLECNYRTYITEIRNMYETVNNSMESAENNEFRSCLSIDLSALTDKLIGQNAKHVWKLSKGAIQNLLAGKQTKCSLFRAELATLLENLSAQVSNAV
jgi:hypothetical protein